MKVTLLALIGVSIILGSFFFYAREEHPLQIGDISEQNQPKTYRSEALGVSFTYPGNYYLEEKDLSTGKRTRYTLILTQDTEENRQIREGTIPPREGPTAITVDVYQNDLDHYTTEGWVRGTNDSNFKLSLDNTLTGTLLGGEEAITYRWSGLYEGESVVAAHPRFVYMLSVTYLSREDMIVDDFEQILQNFRFIDGTPELE